MKARFWKKKKKRMCRISYMLATNRRKRLIHSITLKFVNISICQRHQKKLAIDWNMIFAGHKIEGLVINLNKEVPINQDKKKNSNDSSNPPPPWYLS